MIRNLLGMKKSKLQKRRLQKRRLKNIKLKNIKLKSIRLKEKRKQVKLQQHILDKKIAAANKKKVTLRSSSERFNNPDIIAASGSGVYVGPDVTSCRFVNCRAKGNSGSGWYIVEGAGVSFYNSEASENGINGFTLAKKIDNSRDKKEVNMSKNDNVNKSNIYLEANIARNNKGAGYLFDKDAKVTAKRNLSEGNSEGFIVTGTPEIQYLKTILNEVLADVESWKLNSESREVLQSDIDTIRIQLEAREPKKIIIRESLISLRNIVDGVATNAIFTGIVAAVGSFS